MIVFCAACNTYPPNPNITRPMSITAQIFLNPPNANTACPRTHREAVRIKTIRGPLLSINIPPASGTKILGNAYKEYRRLN